MAKFFRYPNGITVSEFQMIFLTLNRTCDYQVALKIVRDELKAKKEDGRYWLLDRDRAWAYFQMNFKDALAMRKIDNMDLLIACTAIKFEN